MLGIGPGGFYQPGYRDGAKLRLQMMCLGRDLDPQTRKYETHRAVDGSEPQAIPQVFRSLVQRAIQDSHALVGKHDEVCNVEDIIPDMSPNICIVNFYTNNGRLGLHQVSHKIHSLFLIFLIVLFFLIYKSHKCHDSQSSIQPKKLFCICSSYS